MGNWCGLGKKIRYPAKEQQSDYAKKMAQKRIKRMEWNPNCAAKTMYENNSIGPTWLPVIQFTNITVWKTSIPRYTLLVQQLRLATRLCGLIRRTPGTPPLVPTTFVSVNNPVWWFYSFASFCRWSDFSAHGYFGTSLRYFLYGSYLSAVSM